VVLSSSQWLLLLAAFLFLIALIVAMVAGMVEKSDGASIAVCIKSGAKAFVATMVLGIAVYGFLQL
jgi:hypothetical protein